MWNNTLLVANFGFSRCLESIFYICELVRCHSVRSLRVGEWSSQNNDRLRLRTTELCLERIKFRLQTPHFHSGWNVAFRELKRVNGIVGSRGVVVYRCTHVGVHVGQVGYFSAAQLTQFLVGVGNRRTRHLRGLFVLKISGRVNRCQLLLIIIGRMIVVGSHDGRCNGGGCGEEVSVGRLPST